VDSTTSRINDQVTGTIIVCLVCVSSLKFIEVVSSVDGDDRRRTQQLPDDDAGGRRSDR
jgi:hypothetical protein